MATPKYTVVVPSYKGGPYLKQCVQSVLSQTYADFELAVLENGNADGSLQWLQSLNDPRLKIYPSKNVLSIEENWARALEIPKNEFVTFFGHDDLMDANYLAIMDELVARQPDAALYFAHFRYVDSNGDTLRACLPVPARETGAEFLGAFLSWQNEVNGTGYLMRSHDYDAAGGIPAFKKLLYADHALWFQLCHDSFKATALQECFSYRLHPNSTSTSTSREDYLLAITQFATFFAGFQSPNREFNRVFEQHAPDFFFRLCHGIYMDLLVEANTLNRRLDPQRITAYTEALSRISPQKSREMQEAEGVRLHQLINRHALLRRVYRAYLNLPRGKTQGSAGARWIHKRLLALRKSA